LSAGALSKAKPLFREEIMTKTQRNTMLNENISELLEQQEPQKMRIDQRIKLLGITDSELTPAVKFAVSALLEKLDDTTRDLSRTRETLSELERLVDVDCLAPIPNRRAFMRRLSWAISMHARYQHPSTILYFDLNDFKRINDTYGHAVGDIAIRHVSQILSNTMRESDFIARLGGDEFAIIMYHASEEAARKRGDKIADAIRSTPFMYNGKALYVDVACGFHALQKGESAEDALSNADLSMFVDKRKAKQHKEEAA
jgi:diguanylate cyclase (GGDEF)-like protein